MSKNSLTRLSNEAKVDKIDTVDDNNERKQLIAKSSQEELVKILANISDESSKLEIVESWFYQRGSKLEELTFASSFFKSWEVFWKKSAILESAINNDERNKENFEKILNAAGNKYHIAKVTELFFKVYEGDLPTYKVEKTPLSRQDLEKILDAAEDESEKFKSKLIKIWFFEEAMSLEDFQFALPHIAQNYFDTPKLKESLIKLIERNQPDQNKFRELLDAIVIKDFPKTEVIKFWFDKGDLSLDDLLFVLPFFEDDDKKLKIIGSSFNKNLPTQEALKEVLNFISDENSRSEVIKFWASKKKILDFNDSLFALQFLDDESPEKFEIAKSLIEKECPNHEGLEKILSLFGNDSDLIKIAALWLTEKENPSLEDLLFAAQLTLKKDSQKLDLFSSNEALIDNIDRILLLIPADKLKDLTRINGLAIDGVRESVKHGLVDLEKFSKSQEEEIQLVQEVKKILSQQTTEIMSSIKSLNSTMGVEIECCFRGTIPDIKENVIQGWLSVRDGSLKPDRDSEQSREYVSPILEKQDDVYKVSALCEAIFDTAYTNQSCGLHVHVGILDRGNTLDRTNPDLSKLELIKQILINYAALEVSGLEFPKRNYEMISLKEAAYKEGKFDISGIVNAESIIELNQFLYRQDDERTLASVNLEALFKHGTIEFRSHSGTVNSRDIISWMRCINDLMGLSIEMVSNNRAAHSPEPKDSEKIAQIFSQLHQSDSRVIGSSITNKSLKPSSDILVENVGQFAPNSLNHSTHN